MQYLIYVIWHVYLNKDRIIAFGSLVVDNAVQCTILVFSYDYVFVYDGVNAAAGGRLLASFSGETVPAAPLYAASGHMYILLFSDTNYALGKCLEPFSIICSICKTCHY